MSISYNYVDVETFKMLHVGEGRASWHHWGLMDHEGVTIRLDYLGYPKQKRCFLPLSLLKKLYKSFDNMGNYVGLLFPGDLYEIFIKQKFSDTESETAYDNRTACFHLDLCEDDEGYIHLTPLLPELLDFDTLSKIDNDPTLDADLFYRIHDQLFLNDEIYKYQHARWSKKWINFCNKLIENNNSLKIYEDMS